jgi:hypothetical protein
MKRYSLLLVAVFATIQPCFAQDGSEVDPLLDVAADMNSAAVKLGKLHADKPTQEAQKSALSKLDQLIAKLEQQAQGGTGGSRGTKPRRDSVIAEGPGGMGTLHAERTAGKQWGELPAKERERILQSLNDGFPSHYQKILERYFARLADEKPFEPAEDNAEKSDTAKADTKSSDSPKKDK